MPEPCFAAVLLAAGGSARLGRPKQLIRIGGESLLRRTARIALEAGLAPVFVVLGYRAGEMEPELEGLAVTVLLNERWQEGMGSSLHRGVASVSGLRPEPSGVVLMVCDQLRLNREHLRALLTCQSEGDSWITASFYGGRAGVPAVFSRRLLPALLAVRGDRGARDLIAGYPEQTKLVSWPDGALDLDLPEDLKRGRVE